MNVIDDRLREMLGEEGMPSSAGFSATTDRLSELAKEELRGGMRPDHSSQRWTRGLSRRRLVWVAVGAVVLAALIAPIPTLVHLGASSRGRHHPLVTVHDKGRLTVPLAAGEVVQGLAVDGSTLYIASDQGGNPPYSLSAYDVSSGKLLRELTVPAMPAALEAGQDGRVWLTFYADQNGGPSGTWLLSADLMRRSSSDVGPNTILPIGPDTALFATQYGLETLRMPSPGQPGRAIVRREASSSIGKPANTAPNFLALIGGHVVVQATNGYGFRSHLVVAGQPGLTFGGRPAQLAGYVVAAGNALWVTTSASGAQTGPLVRLNGRLRVTTPPEIRANSIFAQTEEVWSEGKTVFAATAAPRDALVCFSAAGAGGAGIGPVTTLPVSGQPAALAASGDTVYVAEGKQVGTAQSFDVVGYDVPAACR